MTAPTTESKRHRSLATVRQGESATALLPERFLSVEDVSQVLGVPVETLYGWRKKRTGPRAALVGRHLRYDPADVRAWFDAQADKEVA